MKHKRISKVLVISLIIAFIITTGVMVYSMAGNITNNQSEKPEVSAIPESKEITTNVSENIQTLINNADSDNYDKNISIYTNSLEELDIQPDNQSEIDKLIISGYKLPDILIAYYFLYDRYGSRNDLDKFVENKKTGKSWSSIFAEYDKKNPEFKPRDFDSEYMDKLLSTPGIITDDLMICDRVSTKTNKSFEEIFSLRKSGLNWKKINSDLGILNSQISFPYVQVTKEQVARYSSDGKLSKKRVVEAYILAKKTGENVDSVVTEFRAGVSETDIFAKALEKRFY